ncbi:hypothetical protein [Leptospira noguchii]|uniref:hypothetical protein n=1 Tax=Leptospira noguchii TaxID=28182 RepID=UPI0009E442A8|nr:hypothetical protein [Leptospira noguchii]
MEVRGHNQPHRILESKLNSVERRIALETKAQRFPELSVSLPMGRVVGGNSILQRICRNSHRFILRSKYLCGWLTSPTKF